MIQHHDVLKVVSISTAAAVTAFSYSHSCNNRKYENGMSGCYRGYNRSFNVTNCEAIHHNHQTKFSAEHDNSKIISSAFKPISIRQSFLYNWHLLSDRSLPLPRMLSPADPVFRYHNMKKGLKQREIDEMKLRSLQIEITSLVEKQRESQKGNNSNNSSNSNEDKMMLMKELMERISEIAYGKGITPQMREDFLIVSIRVISFVTNLEQKWI
jgi:hypothetical protein